MGTAPIRPLAWEPPYATGAAQEKANKKTKKNQKTRTGPELAQAQASFGPDGLRFTEKVKVQKK